MEEKIYYVYIITNQGNRFLYTGMTNNLVRRIVKYKQKLIKGFSGKYNCNKLVWYDVTSSVEAAINREKKSRRVPGRRK